MNTLFFALIMILVVSSFILAFTFVATWVVMIASGMVYGIYGVGAPADYWTIYPLTAFLIGTVFISGVGIKIGGSRGD